MGFRGRGERFLGLGFLDIYMLKSAVASINWVQLILDSSLRLAYNGG